MEALPRERVVYFGDTARVPYGVKSAETVARYAGEITRFLLARQVKLLIVACNTMAAVALPVITGLSPVPVIEVIEAGARSALAASRTKRIGIIATPSTIGSQAYVRALRRLGGPEVVTVARACPLFVPLVEEGWLDHPATRLVAHEYLDPLLAEQVDTLILGCTHYPLLRPLLAEVAGSGVRLQDSATAVAARAAGILAELGLANTADVPPRHAFHVTDMPQRFQELGRRFLGRDMDNVHLEKIETFGCLPGD
jgi:glutamate racemase